MTSIFRRRRLAAQLAAASLAALAFAAGGCGSSSVSITAPTSSKCQVNVSSSMSSAPASGATGTVSVDATRDCTWAASTSAAWIAITGTASGQGSGNVQYRIAANQDHSARQGNVIVNDQQVRISQQAAPCRIAVSPPNASIGSAGGAIDFTVTSGGCAWTASSNTGWIAIVGASSGSTDGRLSVNVAANTAGPRSGTVTVAGQTITIAQADVASECASTLSATSASLSAAAGTGTIGVTTGRACAWTATTTDSWIHLTAGATATGPATVQFAVDANPQAIPRQGTIAVAGQTYTVSQAAVGCSFALDPGGDSAPAGEHSGSFAVHAPGGCMWMANPDAAWIRIDSGGSGNGDGRVEYTVAANSGDTRRGSISVGDKPFTITQAKAPCAFSLAPTGTQIDASGGSGTIAVTARGGGACGWTAAPSATWVHITAGANGSGNGTVGYSVDGNPGAARSATITIGTERFTISQAALSCSFAISPGGQQIPAAGGSGSFTLTTTAGCGWTAAPSADWIKIAMPLTGSGSATISFAVDPNGGGARTGSITVGGQTFAISQAGTATACAYSLSSGSQNVGAGGGAITVGVTTSGECQWSATSSVDWVAVASGSPTTGSGTVTLNVTPNDAPAGRATTVAIAGQTFTVTQDPAACTFTVTPQQQPVNPAGGSGAVDVSTAGGCSWTAASGSPDWLAITSAASGAGPGTLTFNASANTTGAPRTGTLTIAGQTVAVTQDPFSGMDRRR